MPWYNSDRIEAGKMGEPALAVVVNFTGKAEAFPQYYEPHDFTFAPCQPVKSSTKGRNLGLLLLTDGVAG